MALESSRLVLPDAVGLDQRRTGHMEKTLPKTASDEWEHFAAEQQFDEGAEADVFDAHLFGWIYEKKNIIKKTNKKVLINLWKNKMEIKSLNLNIRNKKLHKMGFFIPIKLVTTYNSIESGS